MARRALFLMMIFTMIALVACGPRGREQQAATTSEPKAKARTVNIGYTGPLSGGAALYGKSCLDGVRIAADEINQKGGITINGEKYSVNVVALDDRYMPNEAATNARRLVYEYRAPVIFVPHTGGIFALQEFNEKEGFLIMAHSSDGRVTQRGNTLTAQMDMSFQAFHEPWSKLAMERFGKKAAIVTTTTEFGKQNAEVFKKVWASLGGEVVAENPVDYNKEADFYPALTKTLTAKPDVMLIGGPSEPTAMVYRQARQLGYKGGFIVINQTRASDLAKIIGWESLDKVIGDAPIEYYGENARKFVEKYKQLPGDMFHIATSYLQTMVVIKAMELSGSVDDARKIKDGIAAAISDPEFRKEYLFGIESFNPTTGKTVNSIKWGIVSNGKLEEPLFTLTAE